MAKTYIDIVKYMVEARFEISGLVEKPDIIGAVFGQTEGLLGSDLDLRELQKNGKIGRIEIDTQPQGSRTVGKLHLPSSLGRVETCILAAAIESVDRVGPFETNFKIDKIEDTRTEKRKKIVNRAKELVKNLLTTEIPDSREISDMVEVDIKSSTVTSYGPEGLAAGPDVAGSEDIILVEGRADVIALLKSDITNCVAIGGATGTIPKTVIDLCNTKETTMFLDGDRGGDMILKGIMNAAEIDFVARAPDGKEVEELQRKEIIKALRSRVPIEQIFPGKGKDHGRNGYPRNDDRRQQQRPQPTAQQARPAAAARPMQYRPQPTGQQQAQTQVLPPSNIVSNMYSKPAAAAAQPQRGMLEEVESDNDIPQIQTFGSNGSGEQPQPPRGPGNQKYVAALDELHNSLRGRLYNQSGDMISEVPIRELIQAIQDTKGVHAIVFDGIITQRLVELANKLGIREVYGIRSSQISRTFDGMYLFTKEGGKV
ncbi:MAG: DNA primase [Candidatus Micrarchaeales archaeon]|nr:DNA primase [Candidatus Micrarchaeales archaeon]